MENENIVENELNKENVSDATEQNQNDTKEKELLELKKSINTLKGKLTTLESKKKDIEKEASDLIASTIYQKKMELERSYDEIIKEAEQRLKVVEKEKEDERKKNIRNLVEHNTRNIKENNVYLKNEIKRVLSENGLPGFINSGFYMSLWSPTSIVEMLFAVVAILIVLLVPTILSFVVYKDALIKMFPNNIIRLIIIILIYLATIFVVGLIWLAIDKWTKKKPEVLKEIKELRKNIEDNKKEIEKIIVETNKGATDDKFDYTKLDREIEAGKIEVENYRNKKKVALENFVNVTQDEITRKVGEEARKGMDAVDKEMEDVKKELADFQKKHDTLKINIAEG